MKWKLINPEAPVTCALVFETDDEVIETLTRFAKEQGLGAASITAIGAFRRATLGYFDWQAKRYKEIPVDEQVEVLSALGDIADTPKGPALHLHAVLGRADGSVRGGHLLKAYVRPTLEVVLTEAPRHLHKRKDEETGLMLIAIDDPQGG